jgi:hypothetical protein
VTSSTSAVIAEDAPVKRVIAVAGFARHSHPKPLRFAQPGPRFSRFGMVEVSDRRFRERLAERRHAMLPLFVSDHREPLYVCKVFDVELDVLPQRSGFPTVKPGHVEQDTQFAVLPDESLELGLETLVIYFCELPADVNDQNLPAVLFIELNGHC